MARKRNEAPIDKVPSTVVAIALLLIGLPVLVGAVTTNASSSTYDWESTYDPTASVVNYPAWWAENGANNSFWYENNVAGEGHCSYIEPYAEPNAYPGAILFAPECHGFDPTTDTLGSPNPFSDAQGAFAPLDYYAQSIYTYFTGSPAIYMPQSHEPMSNYQGSSGDGPFSIVFEDVMDHVPSSSEDLAALRFRMVDPGTQFVCDSAAFKNITFSYELHVWNGGSAAYEDALVFERFYDGTNKVEMEIYDFGTSHWDQGCWIGLDLVLEFDRFESLELDQHLEDNYSNMRTWLRIEDVRVEGSQNIGSTDLPFTGTDFFLIDYSFSTVNEQEVNFQLKGATLLMSVIIFAVALGSTTYWDPVRAYFRGRM